ncbi:cytoskeleton protein RodZ [Vibrio gazogenes]|uniref:Cytoskeleton protein RodZ n=1 Tax=Vibrio gazogenes DSM 21264 = NBRC 103151 TaxID=1123492 RepID=A0A1M5G6T6_VIBGA|nr:cytoskeleton protein RodZ [Vibrio gazogenes]USP15239.1 cytoskeleton protein RodZ [Vibrio gazogenes]SHF99162.1 cytoskeleton protein RodZ [Vibrio gazogenes DSM 21264] [Vibrio gazogenes DSM 21264 = NBRC 103151]SJN59537.1 Cytoskeleton protein RodZ [Vibrio gazogenes]
MTESEIVKEEDNQIGPGTLLKQKRESLGLTQKQIADKLRLRLTIIQSLEENNFDIDKVSTFTRGYVRSYAKLVGIDEPEILTAYEHYCGVTAPDLLMTSFSRKTTREQHNSRINLITVGIVAIVIGISSVWWYQNQKQDTLIPAQTQTSSQQDQVAGSSGDKKTDGFTTVRDLTQSPQESSKTENAALPAEEPEANVADDTAVAEPESAQPSQDEQEAVTDETDTASAEPVASDSATPPADEPQSSVALTALTMNFANDCWVRITDTNGKTLVIGLKKANQSVQLQGEAPFKVILGAPESVSMTFAGEPVDLSGYTSGKVARFSLP